MRRIITATCSECNGNGCKVCGFSGVVDVEVEEDDRENPGILTAWAFENETERDDSEI